VLRILPTSAGSHRGLTRREIFQRFLGALGAGLASVHIAGAHPIHKHLEHPEHILDAGTKTTADDWSPEFLDVHQNETLIILSEHILPGSTASQVNRLIDLLLTVEAPENRKNFVAAIAAMDGESQKRFGRLVKALSATQMDELLTVSSTAKSARPTMDHASSSDNEDMRAPVPGATLRDHFENLKGWVVGAYYSSESGMRELGWTEETYFDAIPECSHAEEHR
jgi:hypothetical protein